MSQDSPPPRKRRRIDAFPTPPDSTNSGAPSSQPTGDVRDGRQSANTLWSVLTHGPPAENLHVITTHDEAGSKESPKRGEAKFVCFGMIKDIVVELSKSRSVEHGGIIPVTLEEPYTLLRVHDRRVLATLTPRTATIIRKLMEHCILQLFCLAGLRQGKSKPGGSGHPTHKDKKQSGTIATLRMNVYGSAEIGEVVGNFFAEIGWHLQDPTHCDRDVAYRNPHLLFADEGPVTTLSLAAPLTAQNIRQFDNKSDFLELLRNEQHIMETETPAGLTTPLFNHQKQALTFMLRREAGWDFTGGGKDVWEEDRERNGGSWYINTITEQWQDHEPPDFKGGLLADQMGLGKSLSMIALIAANPFNPLAVICPETDLAPVKTTLLVVPSPLLKVWTYQLKKHTKPGALTSCIYHGKYKRKIVFQGQFDVVITTYKTLALQWERARKIRLSGPSLDSLLSVLWHRVILDEAHVIQNRQTSIARACNSLNATSRWALTGTPIQNRLTNLASIFEFLRVYPFSDPKVFDSEITKPCFYGDQQGILRLKTLANYVTLCRTHSVVNLPKRIDQIHHLDFSSPEQEQYDAAKMRVANMLDDAIMNGSGGRGQYLNALQWLNALRLICNHGVLESCRGKMVPDKPFDNKQEWNNEKAQAAFQGMICTGTAICSGCAANLSETYETTGEESLDSGPLRLLSCFQLLCDACFQQDLDTSCCPACSSDFRCPGIEVTMSENSPAYNQDHSPGYCINDTDMPIKLKTLVNDLEGTRESKSVVFSYWTLTLDFIEIALNTASISYTRLDGKMSVEKRTKSIHQFQQDPDIQVMLVSITCGGAGFDLTAASRAYLMEPQWNPMIEEQAMCRIYRMGQTKDITTIRYRIRDTFEENVVALQDRKKDLASLTFAKERLSETDIGAGRLQYLRSVLG